MGPPLFFARSLARELMTPRWRDFASGVPSLVNAEIMRSFSFCESYRSSPREHMFLTFVIWLGFDTPSLLKIKFNCVSSRTSVGGKTERMRRMLTCVAMSFERVLMRGGFVGGAWFDLSVSDFESSGCVRFLRMDFELGMTYFGAAAA